MNFIYALKDVNIEKSIIYKNEVLYIKNKNEQNIKVISITNSIIFNIANENINNTDYNKNLFAYFDPSNTGDNFSNKVCNICHRLLPIEQFQINQHGINNRIVRRPSCNDCRKIIDGVPISISEKQIWDKKKPHLEPFECPICKKCTIPGLTSKVVLDHNHNTGKGRAWICDSCNTGLGRFKDNIDLLKSAIHFLEKD